MNKYYNDDVYRLSVLISFFMSEYGSTIHMISDGLQIDRRIIREDVINLYTFKTIRGLLNVEEDEQARTTLENYRDSLYELTDLHKLIHNSFKAEKKDIYAFIKEMNKNINKLLPILPEETRVETTWKSNIVEMTNKMKTVDDLSKLLKQIENAKNRYMRRIVGTGEGGERKGFNKDGKKYGIRSGIYDNTVFKIDARHLKCDEYNGETLLVLSSDQYTHLNEFLKQHGTSINKMDGLFKVKNSLEMKEQEAALKYCILDKIQENKNIKFYYRSNNDNGYQLMKIKPEWINYNADTGFLYIIDSYGYKYRFDRIKNVDSIKTIARSETGPITIYHYDRCVQELNKGEVIDVKEVKNQKSINVRIIIRKRDGFNNLIKKIKEDVRRRNMDSRYNVEEHFSENDNEYIYTDKILESELGNIKSWIYSYGSSMVVESPQKLRKEIIESYKQRLEFYS